MTKFKDFLAPLLGLIFILILWQLLVASSFVPEYILASPTQIFQCFLENQEEFLRAFASTTSATIIGLALSILCGLSVAILFSFSKVLHRSLFPLALFFQTVPIVSIAPLMVIWFGFGQPTVKASALIVSFFPTMANAMLGFSRYSQGQLELFRVYGASGWKTFWYLKWPSAIPSIMAGIKISCGLAVVGSVVGEFVAGGGLGSVIDAARTQQRVDRVFAAVILSSLLGLLLLLFVKFIEWFLKKKRYL